MYKWIFIIVLFIGNNCCGQNLVPNYSFETHDTCPNNLGKICYAAPWFQPNITSGNVCISSSDYFNQCSSYVPVQVPYNFGGYQQTNTGNAYAGIGFYDGYTNNIREYIEVGLVDSFTQGKKYYTEFYVSLGNICNFAIDALGAYFSKDSVLQTITSGNNEVLPYIPQVKNPTNNFIADTMNWIKVSGSFIAGGGEKFLTIGNFSDSANTNVDTINGTWDAAYYYIDDVFVIDSGWVGINEQKDNISLSIFPNPATAVINISYSGNSSEVFITDVLGQKVLSIQKRNTNRMDVSNLPSGIYFLNIRTENGILVRKVIRE